MGERLLYSIERLFRLLASIKWNNLRFYKWLVYCGPGLVILKDGLNPIFYKVREWRNHGKYYVNLGGLLAHLFEDITYQNIEYSDQGLRLRIKLYLRVWAEHEIYIFQLFVISQLVEKGFKSRKGCSLLELDTEFKIIKHFKQLLLRW